jgi:hypothetical protein
MDLDRLKPLVNSQHWPSFVEWLNEELEKVHVELEWKTREDYSRAQGDAFRIRKLQKLKDTVNGRP